MCFSHQTAKNINPKQKNFQTTRKKFQKNGNTLLSYVLLKKIQY